LLQIKWHHIFIDCFSSHLYNFWEWILSCDMRINLNPHIWLSKGERIFFLQKVRFEGEMRTMKETWGKLNGENPLSKFLFSHRKVREMFSKSFFNVILLPSSPPPKKNFLYFVGWWTFFFLKKTSKNISQSFLSNKRNLKGGKRNFHLHIRWLLQCMTFNMFWYISIQ
jgi:hypothetical protein